MGLFQSQPNGWRKMEETQDEMVRSLKAFKISNDKVKDLNILLCGPVGAGKSSIINTVNSVFKRAISIGYGGGVVNSPYSQTLKFGKIQVGNSKEGFLPFVLHDTMGLENDQGHGVHTDDIITALKGHMKDGYKFNHKIPMKENNQYYVENPGLSGKMHCLVFVIPADKIPIMEESFFKKMKKVRDAAVEMDSDFPQLILMTKVDQICPQTDKNLRSVYKSKIIEDKMRKCHEALGVKMQAIFPVQNYHEEIDIKQDVNCLMLQALTRIVRWADDYVGKYANN